MSSAELAGAVYSRRYRCKGKSMCNKKDSCQCKKACSTLYYYKYKIMFLYFTSNKTAMLRIIITEQTEMRIIMEKSMIEKRIKKEESKTILGMQYWRMVLVAFIVSVL